MKRLSIFSFLVLLSLQLPAQTVDQIIDKYFAQTGGKDKWAALKSVKTSGKAKAQGMDLPVVMLQEAPNKMKLTINFQGKELVQPGFDGQTAWATNFMTMKPEKMEAEDSELMKQDTELQDPFLNYQQKGYKAELQGKETIEGTECYKVKLTKKPVKVDGKEEENVSYYFFSVADNVPIMVRMFGKKGPTKGQPIETYLSDYQEVNGLFFPFTTAQKMNGQEVFSMMAEKIELNGDIDDKEFVMPGGK